MVQRKGKKNPCSRSKGARYERKIGKKFREWLKDSFPKNENPDDFFKRTPGSGSWSRKHCPGEDLVIPTWFPFSVEIKHREHWDLSSTVRGEGPVWVWWEEAKQKVPRELILVFTKNYEIDWILMSLDTYNSYPKTNKKVTSLQLYIPERGKFVLMPLDSFFEKFKPKGMKKR